MFYKRLNTLNNLIQNYELILTELTKICSPITSIKQIRQPRLSDLELVALNLTAEYMSYNSELQLFRTIKGSVNDTNNYLPVVLLANINFNAVHLSVQEEQIQVLNHS
ncbi:hypothetical protein EZS27_033382 [termite gut metagenome]|uniref:Uncharacterized protein n=1 Tax=termite gut metagenome TaxID=433724 RepID=A0A5J4Q584_9ZZZZ